VPRSLPSKIGGARVLTVSRRAKYLLVVTDAGTLILHLGMSGSLRVLDADSPPLAHDHVDLVLDSGKCLRFNDPRRFGCLLFTAGPPARHKLLKGLAVEPLSGDFTGEALWRRARGRRAAIKAFIMDSRIVAGVGNIYASEALFRAGIRPGLAAGRVSRARMAALVGAIRDVLEEAIGAGGTTLRDYVDASGMPGYFRQRLFVYERTGKPCRRCRTPVRQFTQGQRSTYWCPRCQR
jgi:formamidopyrimidine-DNA glycosylase